MSVLTYNGIRFAYPVTTELLNDVIYDDSNTDWYLTRYTITTQSIIHMDYLTTIAPSIAAANGNGAFDSPAAIIAAIRNLLMTPRQKLSMTFDGAELIPFPQTGNQGSVDSKNGPQPQSCTYHTLTNNSWFMMYKIIAHYWENKGGNATNPLSVQNKNLPGDTVLYNRWAETVTLDNCNYSTRSRSGKYIIRSDAIPPQFADQSRAAMAVLRVPNGCLRKKSSYTQSEDGLGISYSFEDQEVFKMPPVPAYEASGTYTESFPKIGTTQRMADVQLKLRAPKNVPQIQLLQLAIAVVSAKLVQNNTPIFTTVPFFDFNGQVQQAIIGSDLIVSSSGIGGLGTITSLSMTIDMYDNSVIVKVTSMLIPYSESIRKVRPSLVTSPGSDPNREPPYPERGTLGYVMQAAAYYDPNIRGHRIDTNTTDGNQLNIGEVPGTSGDEPITIDPSDS